MAQLETADFFPPLGEYGGPAEDPWPLAAGTDPLDLGAHRGKELLLIAEPVDATTSYALGPYGPLGTPDYPEGDGEWGWGGVQVTLHPAASTGRSTANDDTPAATYVPGKLLWPTFEIRLFDGTDPLSRGSQSFGIIELTDPDDEMESLLDYVWDGAPLTLKRGDHGTPFSTWETVATFRSAGLLYDLDAKQIRLRDAGWQLSGPLHAEYYDGTGDANGDSSLAGRLKPWALGYCFNIEPVLINASHQVFQFTFTSAQAVSACRHGGAPLTFDADYADYAALAAASVPSGYYATCLAEGLARVNVTLTFGIRLDVIGDADVVEGHPAPTTRAAIARRVATAHGMNHIDDASEIDVTSFSRVESRHTAPVGWYFTQLVSKAEALNRIMAGILGWWRIRPDGRLAIGYVDDPALGASLSIEYGSEGMGKPRMVSWAPPRAATNVSWRTNYGLVADRSQLAGSVSDADAAVYAQAARYASSSTPAVSSLYPTAPRVMIDEAGFWNESDAALEAVRQQNVMGVLRRRWEIDLDIDPFVDIVGSGINITGANRLGLGAVTPLLVVGLNSPGTGATTFEFFG